MACSAMAAVVPLGVTVKPVTPGKATPHRPWRVDSNRAVEVEEEEGEEEEGEEEEVPGLEGSRAATSEGWRW